MSIKQGEIWQIDFEPSVGAEIQKLRPAVVVSDDRIGRFGVKIVVPVTEWKDYYKDYPWIIKIQNNKNNGLVKTSSIECFQIKSFSTKRFIKKLGQIDKSLISKIHLTIAKTLNPLYKIVR